MKISMWMIANRLTSFDPVIEIRDDAPAVLKSARLVYATDCVHICQEGKDVIFNGVGGIIRISDMDLKQAFETLQSVFDFYNDWNSKVQDAANNMDHQTVINECWHIFHNPINLLDANNKVIALSEQYGEQEVDKEWKHLCQFGYSSINFIRYMKTLYNQMDFYKENSARIFQFDKKHHELNCISSAIYFEATHCGRIGIVERDRPLNSGDIQMLNYLTNLLAPSLGLLQSKNARQSYKNVFRNIIVNNHVEVEELRWQTDYMKWRQDDHFQVAVMSEECEMNAPDLILHICNIIRNQIPQAVVFIVKKNIIIIYDLEVMKQSEVMKLLEPVIKQNKMNCGFSFSFTELTKLKDYYNQSLAAMEYGYLYMPGKVFYEFYDLAIYYLLENSSIYEKLSACHPDVVFLWNYDTQYNSDKLNTLWTYIDNGLSLSATAQALYIHRNTLIYRIKKLTEMLHYDLTDVYTRDYIKLSIKIIDLYTKKYKNNITIRNDCKE